MKKNLLTLVVLASFADAVFAATQQLNVFIWSDYLNPAVIKAFEQRFECKVNLDLYEDAESMLAKVQGGGAGLYDVVVPTDHIVPTMIKLNLLAPLRHENLLNLTNLDTRFLNPPYDRSNRFTVAYQWGTVGVLARRLEGLTPPQSWSTVFSPTSSAGPFLLMDSPRDLIGAALKFKGRSVNSVNPDELRAARDLILAAKKRSLGFDGSVGAKNKVLGRTARTAVVYSGEGVKAMSEDPETVYFIPREGSIIWVDNLAVLARAPHRDLAEKFLNFLLDARVGADNSNYIQFSSPNRASLAFLNPADLKNPVLYPPPETMDRLEYLQDLGPTQRLYDEVWTQIKAR